MPSRVFASRFRPMFSILRRQWQGRWLVVEAAFFLMAAKIALRVVPFSRLAPYFRRKTRRAELEGAARQAAILEVRRAVIRTARRLPGKYVCFPRGIAAQAMLRRRGVSTTLIYGAATLPRRGLTGHVWVMDGETGVIGFMQAHRYPILARFESPQKVEHAPRAE